MMPDATPSRFRLLRDTALNWVGDIVWLLPHQVMDHHAPADGDAKTLFAATARDADVPTHLERINDWPGTDASGEGTSIWHPEGCQQPAAEIDMTPEQFADLKDFLKPVRDFAIYALEQARLPAPMTATKAYSDGATEAGTMPMPELSPAQRDALPPNGPAVVLPYSAVPTKGLAGEDRWDVVDAAGHSAGYVNDKENTQAGAEALAAFLNAPQPSMPKAAADAPATDA
jgi:hypothetical protein